MQDPADIFFPPVAHSSKTAEQSTVIDHLPAGTGSERATSLTFESHYISWLLGAMGILLSILFIRLFYLQGLKGSDYRARAEQNRIRTTIIAAPRGQIYDRNHRPLANNIPDYVLTITPADLPKEATERQNTLDQISRISGLSSDQLKQQLADSTQRPTDPLTLLEGVPQTQALKWLVDFKDVPAINVQILPTRQYVDGPATAAVLGYIGKVSSTELKSSPALTTLSYTGKTGLEREFNSVLMGHDGEREVERDVHNQERRVIKEVLPEPGKTLQLGLDLELQQHLYDALSKTVDRLHSPGGAAVAMDPRNGEILALVSAPTYDNNWFVDPNQRTAVQNTLLDPRKLLLNRAVAGQYPSGSIVKPFISVAGLEEKIITPSTTVLSVGGFKVGNNTFPDWKAGGHGVTNLAKALAESVNTYYYVLGGGFEDRPGLGVDRIVSYLQRFGWGSQLGIDLPSEAQGFLPDKDWRENKRPTPWRLGDTYHLSIGQGDLQVTPLQVATALSAIANNGTLYAPHLVTAVLNPDGSVQQSISPKILRSSVANSTNLASVRNGLREGVLSGSSRSLQSLPVTSAGKTGTAQFGTGNSTHSWYGVFAPYENPSIVLSVIVEAGGEGNAAALPVAKEVLDWYFHAHPNP